ncbi:hypothetical protein [Micromonospora sp. ALFpr18c]|uniref:hypothetical protein n=1 Tax=Micromonospora sp. ALFpr18c TaxID=1458665 RepID=UPI001CEDE4A8|nr:hypothetical protein [Micromonospora sp. ALFpr18c]
MMTGTINWPRLSAALATLALVWVVTAGLPADGREASVTLAAAAGSLAMPPPPDPEPEVEPAPTPTSGYPPWHMKFRNKMGATVTFCWALEPSAPGQHCGGQKLTAQSWDVDIPYQPGDRIFVWAKVVAGQDTNHYEATGAANCTISGATISSKFDCDNPGMPPPVFPEPSISPFNPLAQNGAYQKPALVNLLNVLAWCVSAAGVGGLLFIGTQMALQVRLGYPGRSAELRQEVIIVAVACIIAAAVGPIVMFLDIAAALDEF